MRRGAFYAPFTSMHLEGEKELIPANPLRWRATIMHPLQPFQQFMHSVKSELRGSSACFCSGNCMQIYGAQVVLWSDRRRTLRVFGSNRELCDSNHVYVHLIGWSMQHAAACNCNVCRQLAMIPMHGRRLGQQHHCHWFHSSASEYWWDLIWCSWHCASVGSQPCTICHKSWSDTANETRNLPACRVRARLMMNSRSLHKSKCHQIWPSAAFLAEA